MSKTELDDYLKTSRAEPWLYQKNILKNTTVSSWFGGPLPDMLKKNV